MLSHFHSIPFQCHLRHVVYHPDHGYPGGHHARCRVLSTAGWPLYRLSLPARRGLQFGGLPRKYRNQEDHNSKELVLSSAPGGGFLLLLQLVMNLISFDGHHHPCQIVCGSFSVERIHSPATLLRRHNQSKPTSSTGDRNGEDTFDVRNP